MKNYKLLTPGPLTTTASVKQEMLFDHCTWDDDYKKITQKIRKQLLELAHVNDDEYTVVLMQIRPGVSIPVPLSSPSPIHAWRSPTARPAPGTATGR